MIRQAKIVLATLAALLVLDLLVALVLPRAPGALQSFFDYGRSVPGKLADWQDNPKATGNLQYVAWRGEMLQGSQRDFLAENPSDGPRIRSYGMSFTLQMLEAAQKQDPSLVVDSHNAPGAPPNFTYSVFLDDRANRRVGDIVILGVLSKNVPALASFSNRVWAFEQPAPFTYPIFRPAADGGLTRIDPVQNSLSDYADPVIAKAFDVQIAEHDLLRTPEAFDLPWLDASPFARLLRRAVATGAIDARKAAVTAQPETGPMPWAEVLRRMVTDFARVAREDGQIPIVVLVQTQGDTNAPLLATLGPTLKAQAIPFMATEDLVRPMDSRAFVPDGHFTPAINTELARRFLAMPELAR